MCHAELANRPTMALLCAHTKKYPGDEVRSSNRWCGTSQSWGASGPNFLNAASENRHGQDRQRTAWLRQEAGGWPAPNWTGCTVNGGSRSYCDFCTSAAKCCRLWVVSAPGIKIRFTRPQFRSVLESAASCSVSCSICAGVPVAQDPTGITIPELETCRDTDPTTPLLRPCMGRHGARTAQDRVLKTKTKRKYALMDPFWCQRHGRPPGP